MTSGLGSPPGGEGAGEFFDLVYDELRTLAAARMRGEPGDHTLQPTAVVHEAWLRLEGRAAEHCKDRTHFMALAARTIRRVLVDHARGRGAEKRGGGQRRESLSEASLGDGVDPADILSLDDALVELGKRSERQTKLIELRFFGGLSVSETAQALGVSAETVKRDWRLARAWLHRELNRSQGLA